LQVRALTETDRAWPDSARWRQRRPARAALGVVDAKNALMLEALGISEPE